MMQPSHHKPNRPLGVIAIAVIATAGGVLSLFGGVSVLAGMASGPAILAAIVIIFGIMGIALGAGFYPGAGWAWMAGIAIYLVSIGLGFAEVLYGGSVGQAGGVIRIIAGLLIPAYLTRKGPKAFFRKGQTGSTSQA